MGQDFDQRWKWFLSEVFKAEPSQQKVAQLAGLSESQIKRLRNGHKMTEKTQKQLWEGLLKLALEQLIPPPQAYVELALGHLLAGGDRPPPLEEWRANQKAPVAPEGTTEAADRQSSSSKSTDPATLPVRSLGFYEDISSAPEDEEAKRLLLKLGKLIKVTVIESFSFGGEPFSIGRTFLLDIRELLWWRENVEGQAGKQYFDFDPAGLNGAK